MTTLIKNGTVVTAGDTFKADVLIEGEKVTLIGQNLAGEGHEVIDAEGLLLLPGGIDVHTHLDLPFGGTTCSDDFFTGHRAAAFGGTTTHIDFAIQPIGGTLRQGVGEWHHKAEGKACIDYGFHVAITDLRPEVMDEIPTLIDEGVTSLKLFMAYKGLFQVDDTTLFRAMLKAAENGMLIMVHAENGDVIAELVPKLLAEGKTDPKYHAVAHPALAEGEATGRAIALAGIAGAPLYVVHMTCQEAIEQLQLGRAKGLRVMGETCTQYMFVFEEDLARPGYEGAKFVCSPPVRQPKDAEILWKALADNTLQAVSTDHAVFWYEGGVKGRIPGKELGLGNFAKIPNGMPGIEDRMPVMWHHGVNGGRFNANRFVEITATNPAKIFGLYPRKGTIAVGSDADIVLWDPNKEHTISAETHHMNTDYNVYEGMQVKGWPARTLLRGQSIVVGTEWHGQQGGGAFLRRSPHAEVL
ncbi:MAG: dihydropyrimidinase [Anaerolineae bacterium]|nr:dihydropyrimidinase [Anaerolineales bacterium]MCQ3973502.1 dihydropyrimidinase [Anaerolineae bacterium]